MIQLSTKEDVDLALFRRASKKRPKASKRAFGRGFFLASFLRGMLVAFGAIVLIMMVANWALPDTPAAITFAPFIAMFIVLPLTIYLRKRTIQLSAFPYVQGKETTYSIDETGVSESADGASMSLNWPSIQGFVEDEKGLFFYRNAHVLVIPNSALGSRRAEVVSAIRTWSELE